MLTKMEDEKKRQWDIPSIIAIVTIAGTLLAWGMTVERKDTRKRVEIDVIKQDIIEIKGDLIRLENRLIQP